MRSGLHVRSLEGMTMKEYKLFKTAKKTAKENGLVLEDGTYLYKEMRIFDFSLLDKMDMPDMEKEVIRKCAIQTVSGGTRSVRYLFFDGMKQRIHITKGNKVRLWLIKGKLLIDGIYWVIVAMDGKLKIPNTQEKTQSEA